MKEWEAWAIIASMIAVASFIFANIVNYGLIIFGGPNLGLLLPIKTIIIIGIFWSFVIIVASIISDKEKGLVSYTVSFITLLIACVTTYWAFFVEKIHKLDDISSFKNAGMVYLFIYGSIAIIIGMVYFFYFAFGED